MKMSNAKYRLRRTKSHCSSLNFELYKISKVLLRYLREVNFKKQETNHSHLQFIVPCMLQAHNLILDKYPNYPKLYEGTLLHLAVHSESLEEVNYVLENQESVNNVNCPGLSCLYITLIYRNKKMYDLFIKHGASIDSVNKNGKTALHVALTYRQLAIALFLISNGADVNIRDKNGKTSVHLAAKIGYSEIFEVLLEDQKCTSSELGNIPHLGLIGKRESHTNKTFIINNDTSLGLTPLHIAVINGHERIVNILLKHGANVNTKTKKGQTPLYFGAKIGHVSIVKTILSYFPEISNTYNKLALYAAGKGNSIQHTAIVKDLFNYGFSILSDDVMNIKILRKCLVTGNVEILEELLKNGINSSLIIGNEGKILIHETAIFDFEMTKLAIKYGSDVNARDAVKETPLNYAVYGENLDIIKLILDNQGDINLKGCYDRTPLHIAAENGFTSVVKLLLEYNVDVNITDLNIQTPLFYSAKEGHFEATKLLLSYGANANYKSPEDITPLHFVGNTACAKLLLDHLDVNITDMSKRTPLFYSILNGNTEVTEYLLKNGANVNAKDIVGNTVLHVLMKESQFSNYLRDLKILFEYGIDVNILNCIRESRYQIVKSHRREGIERFIEKQFEKLELARAPLTSSKHLIWTNLYYKSRINRKAIVHRCKEEIGRMKSKIISNSFITFYDILIKNINLIANYLKDINILAALENEGYKVQFPTYATLITRKIKLGKQRRDILQQNNMLYVNYFGNLSHDCIERIYSYLSNDDLKNIISAFNK